MKIGNGILINYTEKTKIKFNYTFFQFFLTFYLLVDDYVLDF